MKSNFWEYIESNWIWFGVLLAVLVLAVCFWNLYRRQKRLTERALECIRAERDFYQDFSETEESCYLSVRSSDMSVLYASSNFKTMTGISGWNREQRVRIITEIRRNSGWQKMQMRYFYCFELAGGHKWQLQA